MWNLWHKDTSTPETDQPRTPKKERLMALILTLKEQIPLPPMVEMMVSKQALSGLFNQLDDERIDAIVAQLKEVIDYVEDGGETPHVDTH